MKRSITATVVAVLAIGAAPAGASSKTAHYYVTKFDGTPQAKMAFVVRSGSVNNMIYRVPLRCRKDRNAIVIGEASDARIRDGRFVSETVYGATRSSLARVRGRGFPTSPNGFLRARFDDIHHRPCGTGRLRWTARDVTVDAWRKYRRLMGASGLPGAREDRSNAPVRRTAARV